MADLTSGEERCDGFSKLAEHKRPSEYDHDRIWIHDLIELGVVATDFGAGEVNLPVADVPPDMSGDRQVPLRGSDGANAAAETEAAGHSGDAAVVPPSTTCVPEYAIHDAELLRTVATVVEAGAVADEAELAASPATGDVYPFEIFDLDEDDSLPAPDESLDLLWLLEVPEAGDEETVREVSRTGLSSDERAVQLALAFLRDEGLYSEDHLDLLTDIIQQRGWSSVQCQVRGLVRAGYDITHIHRMFQLTDAWLHCVESDTLAPERWHGGKRLTWLEAAQLLDFIGYDAAFEQIADFLFSEQEVWQGLRRDSGQLATFKNYLFGYRLSPRTQVDDGIWQVNLDPGDMRSFDGSRNPLYLASWWDEPLDGGARNVRQMFGAICDPARIADWLSLDEEGLF